MFVHKCAPFSNKLIFWQSNQPGFIFCSSPFLLFFILQFTRVHVLENSLQYLFPKFPKNCVFTFFNRALSLFCLHKILVRSPIFVFLIQHLCELCLGILYETQSQHLPLYLLWKSNYIYFLALAKNYLVPITLFVHLQLIG